MKVIRRGVFEINSSSSHSLVIKKKSEYFNVEEIERCFWLDDDGKISFLREEDLEFGRFPFNVLSSPYEKLRYLLAAYSNDNDKTEEIIDVLKEILNNCSGIEFPTNWDEEEYHGSIDHESDGILSGYLEENNISFKEFLLNKRYIIIVDGDEYSVWNRLKRTGVINPDEIEVELPNYNY